LAGLLWQIVVVGIAVAIIAWLWSNAVHNLSVRRISTGFAFLGREAGMPIADSWLAYSPKNTYLRAFLVGIVNTLRVAVIGIVLATVVGTLVGIARLSSNWLLSRLAAVYVEVLRDLPLLLQLLFWYVMMQGLPAARNAWKPVEGVFLSNRGLVLPSIPIEENNLWVIGAAAVGLIALYLLRLQLIARQMQDGRSRRLWPYALILVIGLPALLSFALGVSWTVTMPQLGGFNFVGGLTLAPEYFALLVALVTSAAGGDRHLHFGLHCRNRPQRGSGGVQGTMGCRQGARAAPRFCAAAHRAAAGASRHHPADDQPVSEPDQEFVACSCGRLSGHRVDREHHAEPDRSGDRGDRADHVRVPDHQPRDQPVHELVQCAHRAGGALAP
jgi:His/Glu/Gln/Arg/opine family amino acid ABC transporter permease subunit